MIKINARKSLLALSLSLAVSHTVSADEHAEQLVGKYYGGLHGMFMETDNDRLTANGRTTSDDGDGFGGEIGYRISPASEFRFSYTDLDIDNTLPGFAKPDSSSMALDYLYFLDKKSFYLVGGLNRLKIDETELSADVGVGYRHYFNERFALYLEGKGHYQWAEDYMDFSSRLGLIYYFGDFKKPLPKPAQASPVVAKPAAPKKVVASAIDSDKDGVVDSLDKCAKTPMSDKVDSQGCTIFTNKTASLTLLVNFDNNKADVTPEYVGEVAKAADFMKTYPHVNLVVEGHTSVLGAAEHNKRLSQKRAEAIVAMLVEQFDIRADRLTAVGYGEERLLSTENSAQAHGLNRRIEARVAVKEKVAAQR